MPPPYLAESPYRVIIEFQKSNAGVGRVIKLAYTSLEVPAQLHGGIPIESSWPRSIRTQPVNLPTNVREKWMQLHVEGIVLMY
eukprot:scaffold113402_cov24-Tisochrysis_lutea.AAC.1